MVSRFVLTGSGLTAGVSSVAAQADADATEAGHGFGMSARSYGSLPVYFMAATATVDGTANRWRGLNLHCAQNSVTALNAAYHVYLQSTGSQLITAALKLDPAGPGWKYGLDFSTATFGTAAILLGSGPTQKIQWETGQIRSDAKFTGPSIIIADTERVVFQDSTGAANRFEFSMSEPVANSTGLLITINNGLVVTRTVLTGSADSATPGYRTLRVLN